MISAMNPVNICWAIMLLIWIVSAFFVRQSATKRHWRTIIISRVILIALIITFVRLDRSGAVSFFSYLIASNFHYAMIGTVLTVLGSIAAFWARISLGRNWSNYVTYKKDHELITTGPYKYIRHPIYSGVILMFIGTFLYYGNLIVLLILAIATIYLSRRLAPEETIMTRLFSERYTDYMKRTKRLIPGVY